MAFFPPGKVLSSNSSIETLAGSGSFNGTYENVVGFGSVTARVVAAGAGTYTLYFSQDGVTDDTAIPRTYDPSDSNYSHLHVLDTVGAKFFKVDFTDTTGSSNAIRIMCTGGESKNLKVAIDRTIARDAPAIVTRSMPSWYDLVSGKFGAFSVVNKFGRNSSIGTSLTPVTQGGFFRTPTSTTSLEAVAASGNDANAGTGAWTLSINGLASGWVDSTQSLTLNGTTAVALTTDLVRLNSWKVSGSGQYGSQSTGSHDDVITIRESGAGNVWSALSTDPYPMARSEIGDYCSPINTDAYVFLRSITTDTSKTTDVIFFVREGSNVVSSPYTPIQGRRPFIGLKQGLTFSDMYPIGKFTGPCDMGFMAKVDTGTAEVAVEFDIVLVESGA